MSTASKPRPLFPLAYNIPKGHVKHSRFLYPMLRKLRLSYHAVLQRGLLDSHVEDAGESKRCNGLVAAPPGCGKSHADKV